MGIRRNVLTAIVTALEGISVGGVHLHATDTFFDPEDNRTQLPKVCVVAEPENILVGLYGETKDRVFRIGIYGYITPSSNPDKTASLLPYESEDMIDAIINALTSHTNAAIFQATKFSVINIGPVINEHSAGRDNLAYVSVPCSVVFLDVG